MQAEAVFTQTHWQKEMSDGTTRYYIISVERDLFDLIVRCAWGSKNSKRGGSKTYVPDSNVTLEILLSNLAGRRLRRGYIMDDGK